MPLKNDQYNALMRIYDRRRAEDLHEMRSRQETIYANYPRLMELKNALSANAAARAKAAILKNDAEGERLEMQARLLKEEQSDILKNAGLTEADFAMRYTCPDCQDTGFIDGKKCHCFLQQAVDLLYNQSNIRDVLMRENFDTLSMKYYDRTAPEGKQSPYEFMEGQIEKCRKYAENFDEKGGNLLLYGSTGVGKTFLSNCIAKALMDSCHSVVYFSAIELFELFSKNGYNYDEDAEDQVNQYILESDLLIIDDLGTERVNSFTTGKLFYTINERALRKKSTVISTNLDPARLSEVYTERVASRILSDYSLIQVVGEDIRIAKRFGMNK